MLLLSIVGTWRLQTGLEFVIDTHSIGIDNVGAAALSCLSLILKTSGALLSQVWMHC